MKTEALAPLRSGSTDANLRPHAGGVRPVGGILRKGYTIFAFYRDADDPRLFVPKAIGLGWTINLDHKHGKAALAAIGGSIATAAAVAFTLR